MSDEEKKIDKPVEVGSFIPGVPKPTEANTFTPVEKANKYGSYRTGIFCAKSNWAVVAIFSLSWIVLLCGIMMLIFSVAFNANKVLENMEKENDDVKDGRKFIFTGAVIFSLVTIILGGAGFVHHCVQHKSFPIAYGIILFPSFVFLIVIGSVSVAVSNAFFDAADEECEAVLKNYEYSKIKTAEEITAAEIAELLAAELAAIEAQKSEQEKLDEAQDIADQINSGGGSFRDGFTRRLDEDYGRHLQRSTEDIYTVTIRLEIYEDIGINQFMCSQYCPCKDPGTAKSVWLAESDNLIYWDRVEEFDFSGEWETYKDCVTQVEPDGDINNPFIPFAEHFRDQENFEVISDWLEFFEKEYSCAGFCFPVLFSWHRPVSQGRIGKACLDDIKDDLETSFVAIAAMALVSGIVLFFTMVIQYFIWPRKCQ